MLTLADVTLARGGRRILEGVSFDVRSGQTVVLEAPNGAGKTTLLRAVAGLASVLKGRIDRTDSFVFSGHQDGLKSALTVRENLQFWANVFGGANIENAVQSFDLGMLLDRPVARLSAGQKRRAGLARVVVSAQDLWILDEPTVSLDSAVCDMFFNVVKTHVGKGGAMLAASHLPFDLPTVQIDLGQFKPVISAMPSFDEAFL